MNGKRTLRLFVHASAFVLAAFAAHSGWSQESPQPSVRGVPQNKADAVTFQASEKSLQVTIGDQTIGDYVFDDETILRPYFRNLRTRSGIPVTRNQPPAKGQDLDDHADMHPGLWLAFADLNGNDFWRNKGKVSHSRLIREPSGPLGDASLMAINQYQGAGGVICNEQTKISVKVLPTGYLLDWRSTFYSDLDFTFGDQEEMGLGVRMATPLTVAKGGEIVDSEGRKNGAGVWGKQAEWCHYSGVIKQQRVGIVLMPSKQNFRRSWFHARDYGLLVANPFGQNAFTKAEKSKVTVKKGEHFRLGFGVLVYESPADKPFDIAATYREYVGD